MINTQALIETQEALQILRKGRFKDHRSDNWMLGDDHLWTGASTSTGQARKAAVLIPIILRDEPTILLTTRAAHLKNHAGQISFPGGRWEPHDCSLQKTALREAQEEVALDPQAVQVIEQLPTYTTRTDFQISPFVGFIAPQSLQLKPDPNEVADIFEVPLAYFLALQNFKLGEREFRGQMRQFWTVPFEQRYIWGATAAMLRNLSIGIHELRGL